MNIICKTDIGLVRDNNQDAYKYRKLSDNCAWVAVCDGMGGANGGNIASSMAVNIIADIFDRRIQTITDDEIHGMISEAIVEANKQVYEKSISERELSGMGTTAVVAVIKDSVAHVAHVGDSRAYLISYGDLKRITLDHSFVQEMVNRGEITEEQARIHPGRNYITRALGVDKEVREDYISFPFLKGELLLLCTDGLSNYFDSDKLNNIINNCTYNELADRLIKSANKQGGSDNITVAVICADNENYSDRSATNG